MALVDPTQMKLLKDKKRNRSGGAYQIITIGLRSELGIVRFEIPVKTVNPLNLRESRHERASRANMQRTHAFVRFGNNPAYAFKAAKKNIIVTLTRYAPKLMDEGDNLPASLKSIRDGIADALRTDDGPLSRVKWEYKQEQAEGYTVGVEIKWA